MREPEIMKAVLTAWEGITNYLTLLPGGMHEYRAEKDNRPLGTNKWAIVSVVESPVVVQTNGGPIREHIVTVLVVLADGSGMTANASLMHTIGTIPTVINKSLDNGGKIIDLWPHPGTGGRTEQTRQGKTVTNLMVSWRVQSRWDY